MLTAFRLVCPICVHASFPSREEQMEVPRHQQGMLGQQRVRSGYLGEDDGQRNGEYKAERSRERMPCLV